MPFLRERSLARRMVLLFALVTGLSLMVATGAFIEMERRHLRQSQETALRTTAGLLSTALSRDPDFGSQASGERFLSLIQGDPHLRAAALYDAEGRCLAFYPQNGAHPVPEKPHSPVSGLLCPHHLDLFEPLLLEGRLLGTLYLCRDQQEEAGRLGWAALIILGLDLGVFGLALWAFSVLQRQLSKPIFALAETARDLARSKDFSIRLPAASGSEINDLVQSLNGLLEELQRRDQQVAEYQSNLEGLVSQRSSQLLEANTELLQAKEKAEDASRAKSAFLANMSHELRTPLNAILLYAELLDDQMKEPGLQSLHSDLEKITASSHHLLSLIDDILDLSRIEAGRMTVYFDDCGVEDLIKDLGDSAESLAIQNSNTFHLDLQPNLGFLWTDGEKLRQILHNFLSNATKFTRNGEVTLQAAVLPGKEEILRFSVKDTGIGMTHDQLERVFREFTQGDESTTRKFGGTGLGLALCRHLADLIGGKISVESAPGKGSTFTLQVPRRTSLLLTTSAEPTTSTENTPREKVLIIDDDPSLRDAVSRMLTREGFWVATASGGEEGLRLARSIHPDVVTLDVAMPGMDGWETLKQFKDDPELHQIPIVLVTMMDDRARGFALGATEYLNKPISRDRLLGILRKIGIGQPHDRILLVEDDPPTLAGLQRILETEQLEVRTARDGYEALETLRDDSPRVILLDLMLPGMDGFQFLEKIREHPRWHETPVVVLTAKDLSAADLKRLAAAQIQKILRKGACSREELLLTIRTLALKSRKKSGPQNDQEARNG